MKISKSNIVIFFISVIVLWMFSGIFFHNKSQLSLNTTTIFEKSSNKIISSIAEKRTTYKSFIATINAKNAINLLTQTNGFVIDKYVEEGSILKQGEKIIQIENNALKSRVLFLKEALMEAELQYHSSLQLQKEKLGSDLAVKKSETALKSIQSDLTTAITALNNSTIIAPFDGVIDQIYVTKGDLINNATPIGRFIDLSTIDVIANISQKDRQMINSNNHVVIDSHNGKIDAKITLISNSADDKTGTFILKATAKNNLKLLDGESVILQVYYQDLNLHQIPTSALFIDQNGDLSVQVINNNIVQYYKVNILDEDEKGIWIDGLPQKCDIVLLEQSV